MSTDISAKDLSIRFKTRIKAGYDPEEVLRLIVKDLLLEAQTDFRVKKITSIEDIASLFQSKNEKMD